MDTATAPARDRRVDRHPVLEALSGFFAGLGLVTLVPFGFAAILSLVASQRTVETFFPLVMLVFTVPAVLIARTRSRRFGLYLLLGMLTTAAIILGVSAVVIWWMVNRA